MHVAALAPHADAILARLQLAEIAVGDHEAPTPPTPPYSILYLLAGGGVDGTIEEPDADIDLPFQITSVGRLAAEARWQADRARAALVGVFLTVEGRSAQRIRLTTAAGPPARDDNVTPPLFYSVDRFALISTPA